MVQFATIILLFLSAVFGKPLAPTDLDGRIVNGTVAVIEDFPYQVSLQKAGSHYCGGSIIGNDWALTAAHCVRHLGSSISPHSIRLRVGSPNWTEGGSLHSVEEIKSHPNYSQSTVDCDLAVIRVTQPFTESPTVHAVALPRASERLLPGSTVLVSGWGRHSESGSKRLSKKLLYAELQIVDHEECEGAYYFSPASMPEVTTRMICAAAYGKDSCQGDSGGPLTYDGVVQYGVVSWGYGCARPKYPGVYTDLSDPEIRGFITEQTGL